MSAVLYNQGAEADQEICDEQSCLGLADRFGYG